MPQKRLFIVFLTALIALLVLVISDKPTLAAAPATSGLGCLIAQNPDAPSQVLNLDTGTVAPTAYPKLLNTLGVSPDGKRYAYLDQPDPDKPDSAFLYVMPLDKVQAGKGTLVRQVVPDSDPGRYPLDMAWTADSRWLVYHWRSASLTDYVGIANADGVEQHTTPLDTDPGDSVKLDSYVLDSQTIGVISGPDQQTRTLTFLSVPDLTILDKTSPLGVESYCGTEDAWNEQLASCPVWSPSTHQAAVVDLNSNHLMIFTPGNGTPLQFDLSAHIQAGRWVSLRWSPDHRFVALVYSLGDADDIDHISLFGLDGSAVYDVATPIEPIFYGEGVAYPTLWWTPDSKAILYAVSNHSKPAASNILSVTTYTLKRYRLVDKQTTILADNLVSGPQYSAHTGLTAQGQMLIQWQDGSYLYTGVVDAETGHKTPLLQQLYNGTTDILNHGGYEWVKGGALAWIYASNEEKSFVIWANPDGSQRHEADLPVDDLVYLSRQCEGPCPAPHHEDYWSVDGNWSVVTGSNITSNGYSAFLVNLYSTNFRVLALGNDYPEVFLSPDSQTAAVVNHDEQGDSLYLQTLLTVGTQGITLEPDSTVQSMAWSPDSSMMAYVTVTKDAPTAPTVTVLTHDGKTQVHQYNVAGFSPPIDGLKWLPCG